jgi:Fe-S cluster assembly protein SufD
MRRGAIDHGSLDISELPSDFDLAVICTPVQQIALDVLHLAPHCRSDLFTKGVIKDSARSVYYGYIRVAEGAQRTDAYQTNRNLLLSPSACADSIPNLEIKANDVRCSHGASVSSVSAEDMFYLMARGLSRNSAEELLVEGFLSELLTRVKHPVLHGWLSALVTEQLARRG